MACGTFSRTHPCLTGLAWIARRRSLCVGRSATAVGQGSRGNLGAAREITIALVPAERVAQRVDGRPAPVAELTLRFGRREMHAFPRHAQAVHGQERLPPPPALRPYLP